ncbi:hypothetical protein TSUD_255930 [Trifolium subterraneum]|uniref:Uncharacterized protein n=1 Tax=Trifolium subterraneum TaxID=3900 RepID=A0A2Z6NVR3_TRISU|nr:hypothetical protein TSUD_255930 [Trifolium subterraneum]
MELIQFKQSSVIPKSTSLQEANAFTGWQDVVVDGVYKKILDYHGPASNFGYHDRVHIYRYFVASYSHLNDRVYITDRNDKIFSKAEIEESLSGYFPEFYVNMFECICRNAAEFEDKQLKMLSHLADVFDFPRH